MTCKELIDFLMDYVEGDLPEAERGRFEDHLKSCPDCVNYLESYKKAVEMGRAACAEEDLPADVPDDLVQAILEARRKKT